MSLEILIEQEQNVLLDSAAWNSFHSDRSLQHVGGDTLLVLFDIIGGNMSVIHLFGAFSSGPGPVLEAGNG